MNIGASDSVETLFFSVVVVLIKDSPHLMLLAHIMGPTILQGLCVGSCPPAAD